MDTTIQTFVLLNAFLPVVYGHDLEAKFVRPSEPEPIVDYEAYSKCLGRCGKDVGCTGVRFNSQGECQIVFGNPTTDIGKITALEVDTLFFSFQILRSFSVLYFPHIHQLPNTQQAVEVEPFTSNIAIRLEMM